MMLGNYKSGCKGWNCVPSHTICNSYLKVNNMIYKTLSTKHSVKLFNPELNNGSLLKTLLFLTWQQKKVTATKKIKDKLDFKKN